MVLRMQEAGPLQGTGTLWAPDPADEDGLDNEQVAAANARCALHLMWPECALIFLIACGVSADYSTVPLSFPRYRSYLESKAAIDRTTDGEAQTLHRPLRAREAQTETAEQHDKECQACHMRALMPCLKRWHCSLNERPAC